jgi:hypothetical protein
MVTCSTAQIALEHSAPSHRPCPPHSIPQPHQLPPGSPPRSAISPSPPAAGRMDGPFRTASSTRPLFSHPLWPRPRPRIHLPGRLPRLQNSARQSHMPPRQTTISQGTIVHHVRADPPRLDHARCTRRGEMIVVEARPPSAREVGANLGGDLECPPG